MKKLLPILLFCFSTVAFAQEDTDTKVDKRIAGESNYNELKINGLYLVIGAIEATYERTLTKNTAIGVSALVPYDKSQINDLQYYISPYYRYFFGKKYASGFFVEGFGMLNSTRDSFFFLAEENFQTDFALGIGFGGKWVSESGFVGELNLGFGRNLFDSDDNSFDTVGKIGITVGYRF